MTSHTDSAQPQESDNSKLSIKEKEDKIAAAKLKLKKFKKEARTLEYSNNDDISSYNSNHNSDLLHVNTSSSSVVHQGHESVFNSGRSTPNSINNQNSESQRSPFPYQSLTETSNFHNQTDYLKEQLQLHVQTIGILVAEKTELHSKLQQTTKKCDKMQDENDELLGRLKTSRNKINEMEKLVQNQQDQLMTMNQSSFNNSFSNGSPTHFESTNVKTESQRYIERLQADLNSIQSLNDEFRMRLSESNDKYAQKDEETKFLQHSNLELKSELELVKIKLMQFTNNDTTDKKMENYLADISDKSISELQEKNAYLEEKLGENENLLGRQRNEIKLEYQNFVDQLQGQVESLVDQINRMTDEREAAFEKLDSLEILLNKSNKQNDTLINDLNDMKLRYEASATINDNTHNQDENVESEPVTTNKEQLLENEIKYFKQQIEILVEDHNNFIKLVDEKEQMILNLNKIVEGYEKERGEHNSLVEQTQNDRQTLSRAILQNKELKIQLEELQNAYVKVSQQNLDLTTQLESLEFQLNQVNSSLNQDTFENAENIGKVEVSQSESVVNNPVEIKKEELNENEGSKEVNSEWGDDDDDVYNNENMSKIEQSTENESEKNNKSLLNVVKKRIEDLEKENQDLNDYIALVNKNLQKQQNETKNQTANKDEDTSKTHHSIEQEEIIDRQLKKIEDLNEKLLSYESERNDLLEKLKPHEEENKPIISTDNNEQNVDNLNHSTNIKLLEDKFTKVMKENADLKDKNQELDHTIMQLQCETDTIVDYITMYQVERKKLNQKYKEKDETIRSLSTQLQVNKLALHEINKHLLAYMKQGYDDVNDNTDQKSDQINNNDEKKQYLLNQMETILGQLTEKTTKILVNVTSTMISEKNENKISSDNMIKNKISPNDSNFQMMQTLSKGPELIICSSCYGDLFIV